MTEPTEIAESHSKRTRRQPAGGSTAPDSMKGVAAPTGFARRGRRRHPALSSRIAATGLSATAMFGIVAALGASATQAGNEPADTSAVGPIAVVDEPSTGAYQQTVVSELSDQPIRLTANVVLLAAQPAPRLVQPVPQAAARAPQSVTAAPQVAPPAPQAAPAAPVARTNGSR